MKNKVEWKKCLFRCLFVSSLIGMLGFLWFWRQEQRELQMYNAKLNGILLKVQEEYPNISKRELIDILNNPSSMDASLSELLGVDMEEEPLFMEDGTNYAGVLFVGWIFLGSIGVFFVYSGYNFKKDREIQEITGYIEEINRMNYQLHMETMSEDELSLLKTEIYKTTLMLKEVAENSKKDKEQLKESLSDISHQIKTPLTSIGVMLDNIMDDPKMEEEVRRSFLRDIKRDISHINYLVQTLLKISKLDSGTVTFKREDVSIRTIAEEAIKNVGMLSDLKSVDIVTEFSDPAFVKCDYRWQVEAVTNILKNCVEHSNEGEAVHIRTGQNQIYSFISIRDFGSGLSEEDKRHLFERFYGGKNEGKDSIGIGLSLAKAIVEQDHGRIQVDSLESGTRFVLKYYVGK